VNDSPWRTSTYSGPNGDCVEVADLPDGSHAVRDTKDYGPTLRFTASTWRSFVTSVKSGEFD
jgi:hypothetical protein